MMKNSLNLLLMLIALTAFAQTTKSDQVIYGDQLSEKEFYDIQNNGWAIFKYRGRDFLVNFSNSDYCL